MIIFFKLETYSRFKQLDYRNLLGLFGDRVGQVSAKLKFLKLVEFFLSFAYWLILCLVTEEELFRWYDGLGKDVENGFLTYELFQNIFQRLFPQVIAIFFVMIMSLPLNHRLNLVPV